MNLRYCTVECIMGFAHSNKHFKAFYHVLTFSKLKEI